MKDEITPGIVLRQILLNQREILNGLSALLTPHCKGGAYDANGETQMQQRLNKQIP